MGKTRKRVSSRWKDSTYSNSSTSVNKQKAFKPSTDESDNNFWFCRDEVLICILIFVISFAILVSTLHQSLPGGDSGELIVAAHELGVAHPPGYPLFTVLAKLFLLIIPLGSMAWRVALLSAVCGALCCSATYALIYSLTNNHVVGIFGASMFSFSRLVWTWSVCAEVFSLNNLLLSLLMLTAVHFERCEKGNTLKVCMTGAFICGLCLSNQHTSSLYIAVILPWVFGGLWARQEMTESLVVKSSLAFAGGLLPYIYLPLSATFNIAKWTWGDQRTIGGFFHHLLRMEYGTLDLLKDHTGQGFFVGLRAYVDHMLTDLSIPVCCLFFVSLFSSYRRMQSGKGSVLILFHIMLLVYLTFFCWRANLDITRPLFFKVVERFWIQSDLVIVTLSAVSFLDVCSFARRCLRVEKLPIEVLLAAPLIAYQIHVWWPVCNQADNMVVHDFAQQTLMSFPNNSIVLTKGDLPSNSFRYFHLCENVRPDLTVFDQEILTYGWSLPMLRKFYRKIRFPGDRLQPYSGEMPDGTEAFTFEDLLDVNYDRHQIFACIGVQDHELSWQASYTLWPYGVCWKLVKKRSELHVAHWRNETDGLGRQWQHQWSQVDDGSWEYVANSEMWRAKTATALFFLELATDMPESSREAKHLLLQSYEIYFEQILLHKIIPDFWHRNFAIVCEKLSRIDSASQLDLLKKCIFHFGEFLRLVPDDPDSQKIQGAIQHLQDYVESVSTSS